MRKPKEGGIGGSIAPIAFSTMKPDKAVKRAARSADMWSERNMQQPSIIHQKNTLKTHEDIDKWFESL